METLTIAEAAEHTGYSKKALARRVERGQLPSLHDDQGRRRIPIKALDELPQRVPQEETHGAGAATGQPHGATHDLAPLLARLEHLAAENGRLRFITESAESLENSEREARVRLEAELLAAKQRIEELEAAKPKRWWKKNRA